MAAATSGFLANFCLDPVDGWFQRAVEEPGEKSESEEVLGAQHVATADAAVLDRLLGEGVHRGLDDPIRRDQLASRGLVAYPALFRLRSSKASVLTTSVPPGRRSARLALSAAGFIATRQSGASPAVRMSKSAIWTWNDDTPGSVPAGRPDLGRKGGEGGEVVSEIG